MRLLLFMVVLATVANATFLPRMFGGRRRGGFTSHLYQNVTTAQLDDAELGTDWLVQKLDHLDSKNTKTWKQRYFFNLKTGKNDSNVNFLYVSGEQTAYSSMVLAGSYVAYAITLGAPIYALEHRFYGASHPTEDMSIENLKYLSSRQAIEDIAEFIRQKNAEKEDEQKWIVVGGSYAGNLAAWSRLKHPELVAGALASSAPLLAQLDFYGYLQTVDEDFKKAGGLCYDQISKGLEEAQRLMQSPEGRDQLTEIFKIDPPLADYDVLTQDDIEIFYSYLLDPFMYSAQYSDPPISNLCQLFTTSGPDYDPLKAFSTLMPSTINVNFTYTHEFLTDTYYIWEDRQWLYQTCTEFGYFQSTDRGNNVFGQVYSTRTYIEYCKILFNIGADQIQKSIEATNEYYGERDYFAGTNVVFSHGTQDPWSYLTKKDDPKHWSVIIVEIEDGDHCSDMGFYCIDESCTDNMRQVQQLTLENMKRWIDPLFPVPDQINITDNVGKRPTFYDSNVKPVLSVNANAADTIRAARSQRRNKKSRHVHQLKRNPFTGKGRNVLLPPPVEGGEVIELDGNDTFGQDWIVQTWDHFNTNEERTFKQKWYFNYKFGSADGPNFLMIGGEVRDDINWVTTESLAWMTYAKEVGANVYLLEHRYYGDSKLGTEDLQYLTSTQMLYDVAAFVRTQQTKYGRTGPWISFGGSYHGALAAWSREWFPELITGAVASSAPVLAKNDFYEYLEVVEDVLKRQSQKCFDRVSEAFERFRDLALSPEGRATLQKKFSMYPAWTDDENDTINPLDLDMTYADLNEVFKGTVQFNPVNWLGVQMLCGPFENTTFQDPLDALRKAQDVFYGLPNIATFASFDDEVKYYADMLPFIDGKDPSLPDDELAQVLWMWQTCNEFGFYQTADYGESIFGTNVPINFYVAMCESVFGVGMDHIEKGVARTNYQYGGRSRLNTTNVVFPNGDADPWHALGVLEQGNLDESVVPIVIKGTSHCMDMHAATPLDPPELTQARKAILENIKKWIAPAPDRRTTTATSTTTKDPLPPATTSSVPTTPPTSTQPITSSPESPTTSTGCATSFLSAIAILVVGLIL